MKRRTSLSPSVLLWQACYNHQNGRSYRASLFLGKLGTAVLSPVADTYVENGSNASNNYGTSQGLVVKNSGGSTLTRVGEPQAVAANVTAATRTGLAGLSIEDSTGDAADPLFEFTLAVDRVAAARKAIDDSGTGVLLVAKSDAANAVAQSNLIHFIKSKQTRAARLPETETPSETSANHSNPTQPVDI